MLLLHVLQLPLSLAYIGLVLNQAVPGARMAARLAFQRLWSTGHELLVGACHPLLRRLLSIAADTRI